eukprot:5220554-Amphidinium_carterae.1
MAHTSPSAQAETRTALNRDRANPCFCPQKFRKNTSSRIFTPFEGGVWAKGGVGTVPIKPQSVTYLNNSKQKTACQHVML